MKSPIPIPTVKAVDITQESEEELLDRLSNLSQFEYETIRKSEAKKLRMRETILDLCVSQHRSSSNPNHGNKIIEDIEPWPSPVDINWIIEEIKKQIRYYCILPDHCLVPLVSWVIGTYCFDNFRLFPRLCIHSPQKRCGKSTLMEVIGALTSKSLMASNASPAVIYRVIESYQATLLLDEADTWLTTKNANDEMRGILNSGHTRETARVLRCEGDNHEPKAYSTWAPMVIGLIGRPPSTLEDRSLMISMRRKLKNESVHKLPIDFKESCINLRRCILTWTIGNEEAIKLANYLPPRLNNDRAMDNWTPLFIIGQLIGGDFCNEIHQSYLALNNESLDEEDIAIELLKDIKSIYERESLERLHSAVLVSKLTSMQDRPWIEWRRGQPMTANSLSRLLKAFEIRPQDIRDGGLVLKGYYKEQFIDAFARYI